MTDVNYDDFCGNWRIFDAGSGAKWPNVVKVRARFAIYCRKGSYFFNAISGFHGGMNNTEVFLAKAPEASSEYHGGASLQGGLKGDFGSEGPILFTLKDMSSGALVISLSDTSSSDASTTDTVGILSHGGPHGVED